MRYTRPTAPTPSRAVPHRGAGERGHPDWVNFPAAADFNDLNPTGGARRDAAGSRIGIIAGGNFPGTAGTHAYGGTPGTVEVDYFRVTPDPIDCETVAPTTTATLDPAAPATGDTYDRVGQGQPLGDRRRHPRRGRRHDRVPHHHQRHAGNWTTLNNSAATARSRTR